MKNCFEWSFFPERISQFRLALLFINSMKHDISTLWHICIITLKSDPHTCLPTCEEIYRFLSFTLILVWKLATITFLLKVSYWNGLLSLELGFGKSWFIKVNCAVCLPFRFLQNFKFWVGTLYTRLSLKKRNGEWGIGELRKWGSGGSGRDGRSGGIGGMGELGIFYMRNL